MKIDFPAVVLLYNNLYFIKNENYPQKVKYITNENFVLIRQNSVRMWVVFTGNITCHDMINFIDFKVAV